METEETGFAVAPRAIVLGLLLVGLAAVPTARAVEPFDPLEPVNRVVFGLNELVDVMLLGPVAEAYGELPSPVRTGVRNVLDNLSAPVTFVNDLLQGETDRAGTTFARFFINSTLGLFGLFDLAGELGHPAHEEDFGQTLAVWGVGEGPFLMLPLLGPSTLRDTAGLAVDQLLIDPWTAVAGDELRAARAGSEAVDTRHRLDPVIRDVRRNSLDPYATVRSAYVQRRAAEIRNRRPAAGDPRYESIFREEEE
ncbi:MAG: VacJ family lipoprotein [Geminicoccaceae bacterium]|nr:VacJ family lipoprotein [Geminicoccaceae bacterium]